MKTKKFYLRGDLVYEVLTGRYGNYAKLGMYTNESEKKMLAQGFEIVKMTTDEVDAIRRAESDRLQEMKIAERIKEMNDRAEQVAKCLESESIEVGEGNNLWASITNVRDFGNYRGCGKGTAYLSGGKLIAWHYGYMRPNNVSDDWQSVRCELSCNELLF